MSAPDTQLSEAVERVRAIAEGKTFSWTADREAIRTVLAELERQRPKCVNCGHIEDDHDGYGGLCDGLGWNASRTICGCQHFAAPQEKPE